MNFNCFDFPFGYAVAGVIFNCFDFPFGPGFLPDTTIVRRSDGGRCPEGLGRSAASSGYCGRGLTSEFLECCVFGDEKGFTITSLIFSTQSSRKGVLNIKSVLDTQAQRVESIVVADTRLNFIKLAAERPQYCRKSSRLILKQKVVFLPQVA